MLGTITLRLCPKCVHESRVGFSMYNPPPLFNTSPYPTQPQAPPVPVCGLEPRAVRDLPGGAASGEQTPEEGQEEGLLLRPPATWTQASQREHADTPGGGPAGLRAVQVFYTLDPRAGH